MTTLLDQRQRVTVSDDVMALLTKDVQKNFPECSDDYCRRGVDQMVGFLAACGVASEPLGPSQIVDKFWHAFVLRTVPYAAFCDRVAGRFIDHVPDDDEREDYDQAVKADHGNAIRVRTIEAITSAGYEVDPEFWPELNSNCNSKCTQCHQGCTDSPTR